MINGWFYGASGLAVIHWFARWREIRWLHYATKPAVLLAIIVWFWQAGGWQGSLRWFGIALVFSLLGDVCLILPSKFFLAGLGAFLVGHLCYIAGFSIGTLDGSAFLWGIVLLMALSAGVVMVFFSRAFNGKVYLGRIRTGVSLYIIVIHIMLLAAISTFFRPAWQFSGALLVTVGALLFAFSDGLLAYDRFVNHIRHAHVWIMMTYHGAQFLMAAGVLTQIAPRF